MFLRSLTGKLSLAFAGFGLGLILLAGFFGIWKTTDEFNRREFQRRDLPELTSRLATFYREHDESWEDHGAELPVPPYAVLLDIEHNPISSTGNSRLKKRDWLRRRFEELAITNDGRVVGFLQIQKLPATPSVKGLAGAAGSRVSFLGFGAIFLTAGISGILVSRGITRPLKELTKATEAVARGDLEYRVPVRSRDEVGTLAKAFNAMNERLQHSQQQKRRLTQDIVHDLAQPILVIRGLAESMQEGVIPKSEENLQVVRQEADRLDALTRNLHFLEQAESNRLALTQEFVAPSDLLARFQTMYQEPARRAGIELQVQAADQLPLVYVDSERFIQVLSNLAANAIQHGARGDSLTLSVAAQAEEVRFTMTDSGPGVPDSDLPHIFDRFYRVDESRSQVNGGSGIGLAIVKSLVEAQDGKVWAEAAEPPGLKVVISLPAEPMVHALADSIGPSVTDA